jgi:hypothetical protein
MRLGGYDNEGILIEPTPMTESYDVYTKTSSYASEHTEVCFEINNGTLKINPSNDDSASEEMCLITPKSAGSIGAVGSQPELWAVPDDSRLGAALAQAATQQLK